MPHAKVSTLQRRRAKQLRQTMTRAETLLWRYVKANRIDGLGFRRQIPIRNYIADFACLSARLIVELDGGRMISRSVRRLIRIATPSLSRKAFKSCTLPTTR